MKSHILIVDDDDLVLSGLAEGLETEGYLVTTAPDGAGALAALGRAAVDLVLTDLVMEGMDGLELLRRVKQSAPDLPVVVITGHGTARSALDAVREGAADYIQKPARSEEIAHRIQTVLDAQDMRRKLAAEREHVREREARHEARTARTTRMRALETLARGVLSDLEPLVERLRAAPDPAIEALGPEFAERFSNAERLLAGLKEFIAVRPPGTDRLDLNELVRAALDSPSWRGLCDQHPKVRVDVKLREGLSAITGSAAALREALLSLLGRLLPMSGAEGCLAIGTGQDHFHEPGGHYYEGASGRYAFVRIQTPCRAADQDLEHLFEPYYACACMGSPTGGFEMTRVYRCVRGHRGFIQVRPDPNAGTEFQLLFPVAEGTVAVPGTVAAPPDAGRILVLDDHPGQRAQAVRLLKDLGYEVDEASGGDEAVARVKAAAGPAGRAYDAVVIDLILGESTDGVDVLRRIVDIAPGQPAVMVGGFADLDRITEARDTGASHYLRKPLTRESLGRALRDLLGAR